MRSDPDPMPELLRSPPLTPLAAAAAAALALGIGLQGEPGLWAGAVWACASALAALALLWPLPAVRPALTVAAASAATVLCLCALWQVFALQRDPLPLLRPALFAAVAALGLARYRHPRLQAFASQASGNLLLLGGLLGLGALGGGELRPRALDFAFDTLLAASALGLGAALLRSGLRDSPASRAGARAAAALALAAWTAEALVMTERLLGREIPTWTGPAAAALTVGALLALLAARRRLARLLIGTLGLGVLLSGLGLGMGYASAGDGAAWPLPPLSLVQTLAAAAAVLGLFALARSAPRPGWRLLSWSAGLLLMLVAAVGLLGHALDSERLQTWSGSQALGPLAGLTHLGIGLALLLLADAEPEARRPPGLLLPLLLGVMVVGLGVAAWLAVLPDNALRLQRASDAMADQLAARLTQRLELFARAVRVGAELAPDSGLAERIDPAVVAVADPQGRGWQARDPRHHEALLAHAEGLQQLLLGLREHGAVEASPALADAPHWWVVSAASTRPGERLRLVVDARQLLASALQSPVPDYAFELHQGTVPLHTEGRFDAALAGAHSERDIEALGQRFVLRLQPLPETAQLFGSPLPGLLLVGALLLGGSLAAAVRMALLARQRALLAEANARGLEREVAARQATESALDRSLDEIGLILASISDGFLFIAPNLQLSFANQQAAQLLGSSEALMVNANLAELWPELIGGGRLEALRASAEQRQPLQFEAFNPHSQRWLELRAFPHPNGLALLLRDVSEARERAQRLAASEAALRAAQRLAQVGSWRLDLHSGRWFWSEELYRVLGLQPGQLPPSKDLLLQCVPAGERTALSAAFDALLSEGRAIAMEHGLQRADGQRIPVFSLAQAEAEPGGGLLAVSGTVQDISGQRRQAEALRGALQRAERQALQLQALHRASLLASRKLADEDLAPSLLGEIREALQAELALWLPAEDAAEPVLLGASVEAGALGRLRDPAVRAFLQRLCAPGPLLLDAVQFLAEAAYAQLRPEALALPLDDVAAVPLRRPGGGSHGLLLLSRPHARAFDEDSLGVLEQFGQLLSSSLERAGLIETLEATRDDLRQKVDALSRSQALLAGAERVVGLGTFQMHFEGEALTGFEASEESRRLFGIEGLGDGLDALRAARANLHEDDRGTVRAVFEQAVGGSGAVDVDYRIRLSGGGWRWVHTQAQLSRDDAGRPLHLLGTAQDITLARGRQQRERELAEVLRGIASGQPLAGNLRSLIDSLESAFHVRVAIVHGLEGRGGAAALEAPSLPEFFRRELLALSHISEIAPSRLAADRGEQVIEEDVLARPEFAAVHAVCRAAGVRAICATPIFAAESRLIGVFTVYGQEPGRPDPELLAAIDAAVSLAAIAIRSDGARRRLEESRQRLRSLFTLVPDAVYALDVRGVIEDCNAAAEAASGRRREQLLGRSISELVASSDREALLAQVSLAALGGIQRLEHLGLGADGRRFEAVTTTLPIMVDEERVGVYTVQVDVSAERRAQAALQAALADVESRNRELQDFAFVASHDLQEPLRKVQAFGDRLRLHLGERLDADGADYLQRMRSAAARMQTLINDLLAYSRVSRNSHTPRRVALSTVLAEVLSDLESRVESSGAQVVCEPLPEIEADPTQMRQLLQNLIGNALKFAQPGRPPRVRIHAQPLPPAYAGGPARTRLRIEDNGIGFDSKYQERIFAPFQRLHGRSEYEGSGIGLAIVRKIVERHGGQIRAEGRPGEGAVFEIDLPLSAALSSDAAVCEDSV